MERKLGNSKLVYNKKKHIIEKKTINRWKRFVQQLKRLFV